jgi:23S rRNA (guanosine2251-2'-O)-methyltransferase
MRMIAFRDRTVLFQFLVSLRTFASTVGNSKRFWCKQFEASHLLFDNHATKAANSFVEALAMNLNKKKIHLPPFTMAIVLAPKLKLLVPIMQNAVQTQHVVVSEDLWKAEESKHILVDSSWPIFICGFLPCAQDKNFSDSDNERPVDKERLLAINEILLKCTGLTAEELLTDTYQSTPPARIYRSFVAPRSNAKGLLTSVELAAEKTALQINFALRQLRATSMNDLIRNQDKSIQVLNESELSQDGSMLKLSDTIRRKTFPIVLVLDNIRSALNVGSMFRTAETAGVEKVITCGITAHPPHPKLQKTALSATEIVPSNHFEDIVTAIDTLKNDGYQIVVMETTSESHIYTDVKFPEKVAIVVGNEITGVDVRIIAKADLIVAIPTFGVKNSLNVAAAAPIVLFEVIRQYTLK